MVIAVCLTLAFLHFHIWLKERKSPATLLFSLAALGAAGHAVFELIMLKATTIETYNLAILYYIFPLDLLLISTVWFIYIYFKTAKRWLANLITGAYVLLFISHFWGSPPGLFSEISSLKQMSFLWGEKYTVAIGTPRPVKYFADVVTVILIIYFVDSTLRLWRRGEKRCARVIGGSFIFFIITAGIHTPLVDAGIIQTPYLISFSFLAIIIAMSLELSRDVVQASILSQEIIASEDRLRSILENVDLLVVGLDTQGIVTFVNRYACESVGLTQENILGKDWIEHFVPESKEKEDQTAFQEVAKKNSYHHYQNPILTHSGELRQISWSNVQMHDREGNVTGTMSIGADITEQVQSRKALEAAYAEVNKFKDRLQEENIYLQEEIFLDHNYKSIIGKSDSLKYVLARIDQVAQTDMTVLIEGETGVGKELIARAVHQESRRKDHPLVKINCAAIPRDIIESELFGHVKGAYTGADRDRKGRFELADSSTIFLDEIGELPLDLQPKLLRVLEEGEFERLGSNVTKKVDVRIIVATNRVLKDEIKAGRFREDLYFRLHVFPITIPPLHQRLDDIPYLVEFFVDKYSRKLGKTIEKIPKQALEELATYSWPGNVRELSNVIERAVMSTKGTTLHIAESLRESVESAAEKAIDTGQERLSLEELERQYITEILQDCSWRIEGEKGAAKILGMHPNTLRNRLQKLGVQRPS